MQKKKENTKNLHNVILHIQVEVTLEKNKSDLQPVSWRRQSSNTSFLL